MCVHTYCIYSNYEVRLKMIINIDSQCGAVIKILDYELENLGSSPGSVMEAHWVTCPQPSQLWKVLVVERKYIDGKSAFIKMAKVALCYHNRSSVPFVHV